MTPTSLCAQTVSQQASTHWTNAVKLANESSSYKNLGTFQSVLLHWALGQVSLHWSALRVVPLFTPVSHIS